MNKPTLLQESPDFSLVLGGPLYQLFRRAHVTGNTLELISYVAVSLSLLTGCHLPSLTVTANWLASMLTWPTVWPVISKWTSNSFSLTPGRFWKQ